MGRRQQRIRLKLVDALALFIIIGVWGMIVSAKLERIARVLEKKDPEDGMDRIVKDSKEVARG